MHEYDIVIVGGGPAGLAAALSAKKSGIDNILILEREESLGGILNQFIHNEFGAGTFNEKMTGPEYAQKFIDKVTSEGISYKVDTTVLNVEENKSILAVNGQEGILELKANALILCMGCRERLREKINIPGNRPAGIYTASVVQRFINIRGFMPGKEVVILGSSDIGLIVAKRMMLEGANVVLIVEPMPYIVGAKKYILDCIDNYNIPVVLNRKVIDIKGKDRLEGVTIVAVDENKKPITGTEEFVACDTLILSADFIPETDILLQAKINISQVTQGIIVDENMRSSRDGIFACGNVVYIHDNVDNVTLEGKIAGENAAKYILNNKFI